MLSDTEPATSTALNTSRNAAPSPQRDDSAVQRHVLLFPELEKFAGPPEVESVSTGYVSIDNDKNYFTHQIYL